MHPKKNIKGKLVRLSCGVYEIHWDHMKKNKVIKEEKGITIFPQWEEVERVRTIIDESLREADVSTCDAMTALCFACIEMAYNAEVDKPQFLCNMSNWWEKLSSFHEINIVDKNEN